MKQPKMLSCYIVVECQKRRCSNHHSAPAYNPSLTGVGMILTVTWNACIIFRVCNPTCFHEFWCPLSINLIAPLQHKFNPFLIFNIIIIIIYKRVRHHFTGHCNRKLYSCTQILIHTNEPKLKYFFVGFVFGHDTIIFSIITCYMPAYQILWW